MSQRFRCLVSMTMTGVLLQMIVLSVGIPVAFAAGDEVSGLLRPDPPASVLSKGHTLLQAQPKYIAGQVLVKFKDSHMDLSSDTGEQEVHTFANDRTFKVKDVIAGQNLSILTIEGTETVEQAIARLEADPNVEYAEPNYTRELTAIPTNDTLKDQLWALDNVGQTVNGVVSLSGADMNVPQAWAISEGQNAPSPIIIAVIDSGVMYTHPDLSGALWDGSSCVSENGNALGGCVHGYDFADNDKDPMPVYSTTVYYPHGTEVSGVIAATKNNNRGVIGIAPKVKIMALRFGFDTASEVRAIDFAIANHANIINASYGSSTFSIAEQDAINRFRSAGGIFVTSAGNSGNNDDLSPQYPASYTLDNIIVATATDQQDGLASFSNYGAQTVDVAAPGVNIYSTTTTISSITLLDETFEGVNVVPPGAPAGWVKTGNWGTIRFAQGSTVLYADEPNFPYVPNANSTVTAQTYDLSGAATAQMQWSTYCDTEYAANTDEVALEASADGSTFTELQRWNEVTLDDDTNPNNLSPLRTLSIPLPPSLFSAAFTFRFRWVSNGNSDTGTFGDGCFIDNVKLLKELTPTEEYALKDGTSFSSPYTAGLAGLIMGYNPALSASEVKAIILSSGDSLPGLAGKTVTGKRINAEKALRAADTVPPILLLRGSPIVMRTVGTGYTDSGATALDNTDGDITSRIVTTNPVNSAQAGSYTVRYNVSDAAGNAAIEVTRTVNVIDSTPPPPPPDTTAPVITLIGSPTIVITVGTTYVDAGATAGDNIDGDSTSRIVTTNPVNTAVVGNYIVKYNVSDAAGNPALEVQRTVIVNPPSDSGNPPPPSPPSSGKSGSVDAVGHQNERTPQSIAHSSGHRGHNTNSILGMAAFVAQQHGLNATRIDANDSTADLTDQEREYICSMQRALPKNATDAVMQTLAQGMSAHLSRGAPFIAEQLQSTTLCTAINAALRPQKAETVVIALQPFAIAADGAPVSSNPFWNLCVRDLPFTFADVQQNPDINARGRHYSCDHYHPGRSIWRHPDLKVLFTWNQKTRELTLPKGYVAKASKRDVALDLVPLIAAVPRSPEVH